MVVHALFISVHACSLEVTITVHLRNYFARDRQNRHSLFPTWRIGEVARVQSSMLEGGVAVPVGVGSPLGVVVGTVREH